MVAGTVPAHRVRRIASAQPFRVTARHFFIKPRGEVHRRFDTDLVRRFDFGAEQVKGKTRVHLVCFARMVCPAVVAFREYGDGVDVTELQSRLELLLGKLAADAVDFLTCVKVEMDLSEIHVFILSVVRNVRFRYKGRVVPCDLGIV